MDQESFRQLGIQRALQGRARPVSADSLASALGEPVEFVQTTVRRLVRAGHAIRHHHITGLTYSWSAGDGAGAIRNNCGRTLKPPRASSKAGRVLALLDAYRPQSPAELADQLPGFTVLSVRGSLNHLSTLGCATRHGDYAGNGGWVRTVRAGAA